MSTGSPDTSRGVLRFIFTLVIGVRAALATTSLLSLRIWLGRKDSASSLLLTMWDRWDAHHYLDLAREGYQTTGNAALNIAFLPLYPWSVRVAALFVRDYLLAGLLVSLIASIAASYFLYHLVRLDLSEEAARASVFFFNLFPTAYFLIAPYTEALFLSLLFGSLYYARAGRFAPASILAALCTATKVNAIVVLPTIILLYYSRRQGKFWSRHLLLFLLVPLGLGLYLALNYRLFGNPLHFLTVQQEHWHHSFRWPWQGLADLVTAPFKLPASPERVVIHDLSACFTMLALAACLWSLKTLPFAYAFEGIVTLAVLLSTSWNISLGRYIYSVVPLFFFLGAISEKPAVRTVLLLFFLPLLGLLCATFAAGRWAY